MQKSKRKQRAEKKNNVSEINDLNNKKEQAEMQHHTDAAFQSVPFICEKLCLDCG